MATDLASYPMSPPMLGNGHRIPAMGLVPVAPPLMQPSNYSPVSSSPPLSTTAPESLRMMPQVSPVAAKSTTTVVDDDEEEEVHVEGSHQCNICGKRFSIAARLQRHYRIHTGEKPFKCDFCEKTFSVKENLNVHRRIHTKERPYKCTICERAFEHSGKLHRHMRTHTGERPHKCEICDKTFVQSGQLVIHMRAHTGEKPYTCDYCQKGFTCSKQLKVHVRTHTGEKPYECDECGKTFGYNHVLKMHKNSHLGERLYKCTLCDEFFNSRKALDVHIREHNSGGKQRNQTQKRKVLKEKEASATWKNTSSPSELNTEEKSVNNNNNPATWDTNSIDASKVHDLRKHPLEVNNNESPNFNNIKSNNIEYCNTSVTHSTEYYSDDSGRGSSPLSDSFSPPRSPDGPRPFLTGSPEGPRSFLPPPHLMNGISMIPNPYHQESYDMYLQRMYPGMLVPRPEQMRRFPAYENYGMRDMSGPFKPKFAALRNEPTNFDAYGAAHNLQKGTFIIDHETLRKHQQQMEEHLLREEHRKKREKIFIESVNTVMVALISEQTLKDLGFPDTSIDDILMNAITRMGSQPCKEPSLTAMDRVKVNLRLLLELSIPEQSTWDKFGWKGKSIEDIIAEFLKFC